MTVLLIALAIFFFANLTNIFYITVLYHRGLAHGSIELSSFARWLTARTGIWITGIDPKAWVCMHRSHHKYSDTERDPHSPIRFGVFGVALGQLRSYEQTLRGLIKQRPEFISIVKDLDFNVSRLNRKKLWLLPYTLHLLIGIGIWLTSNHALYGAAYYFGMMSHPIHGWLVNSLAHKYGYRNFETRDHSTNNTLVSWLVAGEGLQNNHHARPKSPNFAKRKGEVDLGYVLCILASWAGVVQFKSAK